MSRHTRVLNARPRSFLGHGIAVTDAASFNLDAHPTGGGFRHFAFNDFEGAIRSNNLYSSHSRHKSPVRVPSYPPAIIYALKNWERSARTPVRIWSNASSGRPPGLVAVFSISGGTAAISTALATRLVP